MAKIAQDKPLTEITLRRYEKPNLEGRELVRKLCLSMGMLQPGDSRDVVVDVLFVLLIEKKEMGTEEIRDKVIQSRKDHSLEILGVASSNIRRQLKRLREIMLVEKRVNKYRITENLKLREVMEEKIQRFLIPSILDRINEYLVAIDHEFDTVEQSQ